MFTIESMHATHKNDDHARRQQKLIINKMDGPKSNRNNNATQLKW